MKEFETENFIRITRSEARHLFYKGLPLYFGDLKHPSEIGKYRINYKNNTKTFDENVDYFKKKTNSDKHFAFFVRKTSDEEC